MARATEFNHIPYYIVILILLFIVFNKIRYINFFYKKTLKINENNIIFTKKNYFLQIIQKNYFLQKNIIFSK